VKKALHDAIDADLPNLIQLDCALLPGVLAEALVSRSHPGIERVLFTNSGAEAIEAAIKFARHATSRNRILYADHGFHGLTTGALSLNGGKEFRDGFGPLLPADKVTFGDIEALARELRTGDVAALSSNRYKERASNVRPRGLLARGRGALPTPQDTVRHGRGPGRAGADREVLLSRAL